MDDTAAIARRYFDAGWHPFPLPTEAKYPPPEGTTGYTGHDLTPPEIAAAAWDGNLGLRMPVDVIGIDVDVYKGGGATMMDLADKLCPLPLTYVSHSSRHDGSGIKFFRVPVGMAWIPGLPGVEIIQRNHRYAVVWPSTHPEGRNYYWQDEAEPDVPQGVPQVEDLPELPWPWIEELSRATNSQADQTRAVDRAGRQGFLTAYTTSAAPGYFTSSVVGHWHERRAAGFSRHDTMQHCLTWAMECVRAGLIGGAEAVNELGVAWQDALAGEPHRAVLSDVAPTEFEAMLRHAIGKVKDRPQEWFDRMHDEIVGPTMNVATPAEPLEVATIGVYQPVTDLVVPPIRWTEFVNRDTSPATWLAEGFWPWGRALALWAAAKQGKSELALWCACRLALGEHPWGGPPLDEPVDVAYFDFEMTADDLDDRLVDFDIDPLTLDHLHYWQFPAIHALDSEKGGAELEALVRAVGAQAVVIDTFGRSVDGDENDADTIRSFARHTGARLKAAGIGYLRTDHAGKDESKGQRGSSAKRDDVDVVWWQKRVSNGVLLDCEGSSRLSWVGPRLQLDRVVTNDVVSYRTPVIMGVSQAAIDKAAELDRLGVPLDAGRPTVIEALTNAGLKQGKSSLLNEAMKLRRERAAQARRAREQRGEQSDFVQRNSDGNS